MFTVWSILIGSLNSLNKFGINEPVIFLEKPASVTKANFSKSSAFTKLPELKNWP